MAEFNGIQENRFLTDEIVKLVQNKTGFSYDDVVRLLQYNVITPHNFALLSGRKIHTIENLRRPQVSKSGEIISVLTSVYPQKLGDNNGPAFIMLDESAMEYLTKCLQ